METAIRFGLFILIFAGAAALEVTRPKRPKVPDWKERWVTNISILVIDVILLRLTVGAAAFVTALYAQQQGWGLFGFLAWPWWLEALLAFLILDFAIYLQHVMSHALPVFWRLHQVHHADLDVDVTTGTRFHPLEIIISMIYKAAVVAAIGADPWVVLAFEVVLNGFAVFTHANIRIPERIDTWLRYVVCTPDMHRVHHSMIRRETDSNYGFFLSVWDRFCGTMIKAPAKGHSGVELGLEDLRRPEDVTLVKSLMLPVRIHAKDEER